MAIALYDLSVLNYLQTLNAVAGFLEKGKTWASEGGHDLEQIVETRLHGDMLPFRFQIVSVAHHSAGAVAGSKAGLFTPPGASDADYAGLQGLVAGAIADLKALTPDEVNALEGREMAFALGERRLPFPSVEAFILSFSLPNFYFHAATAYDILRQKGVPLGKRDFLGAMRLKTA